MDINDQFQNTFAHNVFADPKVTKLLREARFNPFVMRMRKEVYDLPKPLGQSYNLRSGGAGSNKFLNREAAAYWANELDNLAKSDNSEVRWRGMTFQPGETTSQARVLRGPPVSPSPLALSKQERVDWICYFVNPTDLTRVIGFL
jgi:hypothetical protein